MSSDALAAFRQHLGPKLAELADKHIQHDLNEGDRDALKRAANTVSRSATIGSLIGLGLGTLLTIRGRSARRAMYTALRTHAQPVAIKFANGSEQALPEVATTAFKPSVWGDVATALLLGGGGLLLGGETGLLVGSMRAKSSIARDAASQERIKTAFRRTQADALRAQADLLEKNEGAQSIMTL